MRLAKHLLIVAAATALGPWYGAPVSAQSASSVSARDWGHYPLIVNNGYWYNSADKSYWRYSWELPGQILIMYKYNERGSVIRVVTVGRDPAGVMRRSDSPSDVMRVIAGKSVLQSANGYSEVVMQPGNREFHSVFYPSNGAGERRTIYRWVSDADFKRSTAAAASQTSPASRPTEVASPASAHRPRGDIGFNQQVIANTSEWIVTGGQNQIRRGTYSFGANAGDVVQQVQITDIASQGANIDIEVLDPSGDRICRQLSYYDLDRKWSNSVMRAGNYPIHTSPPCRVTQTGVYQLEIDASYVSRFSFTIR